ncbi:uncharacterized protein LOC130992646 isoform X2 [Salvia miltiorrhiza]|uniref:uncharacterized protein LOC130992646 isoform X2 n=1 Tax=Salvia miltiorrhiza TaxID=226208 RepID=UPI0025AB804A|nr:uncharacterized protein LOC130992646 isoform X2 [Salvia miltiorrhiza]
MSEHEDVAPDFVRPSTINVHSNVSTYYRIDYLAIVKKALLDAGGQPLLDRFLGGCFGHFIDFKPGPKCGMALHYVVSRQIQSDDNGMWFFINGRKIYFSPKDYALITGLHFGSSNFDVIGDHHDVRNVKVFRTFCGGHQIRIAELVDTLNTFRIDDLDDSLHLRVAHVIVLYGMLLGYESDKYVASWIWAMVDDLDDFSRFPWGVYSYQTLSHYTYKCKPKKKYHFYGPVWALHIWSFEILSHLANEVGRLVDAVAHPRCLRWRFRSLPALKDLRHLFENELSQEERNGVREFEARK